MLRIVFFRGKTRRVFACSVLCVCALSPLGFGRAETLESRIPSGVIYDAPGILCGPISLTVAARALGVECDVQAVAGDAGLTSAGVSMAGLGRAAERLGLVPRAYRLASTSALRKLRPDTPAILLLRDKHFVAVLAAERGGLWLARYPDKLKRIRHSDLREVWDSPVLVLSRPGAAEVFSTEADRRVAYAAAMAAAFALGYCLLKVRRRRVSRGSGQSQA